MGLKKSLCIAVLTASFATAAHAETMRGIIHLKEKVSVQELAESVRTPGATRFGQPYTPEEIRSLSAPSDSDYANVINQLQIEGFKVVGQTKTHLWITIEGDSSLFTKVFQAEMDRNEQGARRLRSIVKTPVYMNAIDSIGGLDNQRKAQPHYKIGQVKRDPRSGSPISITSPTGILLPTIRTVYGFDSILASGISGTGQHIAIATYDDFDISDVQTAYQVLGVSPMSTVDKVPFNGTPPANSQSAMETQLDAEFSGMIAPGASVHVFSSATNDDPGEVALFTAILDDNRAKIANYSWGGCETQVDAQHKIDMDKVFAQAIAQGVNIFVASGDSGSDSCQNKTVAADWPANNPNVIAVGGTTLTVNGNTGSEVAWASSGGGISAMYTLPNYQANAGVKTSGRSYPDVAFNADNASGQSVYAHYYGIPLWITIGGTSMAAPQWAGFMALVNNARQAKHLTTLGQLNPIIYAMNASDKAASFNDVTSGSNGAYTAAVGYDSVTGFGSMKAQSLLNYLIQQ